MKTAFFILECIWAIARWFGYVLILFLEIFYCPLLFPFYYGLRKYAKQDGNWFAWFIWVFLDDEDGHYGTSWWREAKKLKDKHWKTAFLWLADRNKAWNKFKLKWWKTPPGFNSPIKILGELKRNGEPWSYEDMAVLKYVNEKGEYRDNKGSFLSLKYSVLGHLMFIFRIDGKLYFRYSYAGRIWRNTWIEFHAGWTKTRPTIRGKYKPNLKIYEYDVRVDN